MADAFDFVGDYEWFNLMSQPAHEQRFDRRVYRDLVTDMEYILVDGISHYFGDVAIGT